MTKATMFVCFLSSAWCLSAARADTFGTGGNIFDIEFVHVGDPENPDDTTGNPNPVGKVEYAYRMGKFEISEAMIDKANALAGLGISHQNRGPNQPAGRISWYEAAEFTNWLNTSTGHAPAYKFDDEFELWLPSDSGYNPANPFRNTHAFYFLPSADEWYKAAYYDPTAGVYYDYPTGSNSVPDGIDFEGDSSFEAVFDDGDNNVEPNDITNVGSLSPYGTAGQGGNLFEWEETELDLINDSSSSFRGLRGGDWQNSAIHMSSSVRRRGYLPQASDFAVGFRIASVSPIVPEPSALTMVVLASLGIRVINKRRR